MPSFKRILSRLVPALVTALGAAIVTAGLLSYGDPVVARVVPEATGSPAPIVLASPSDGPVWPSSSTGPDGSPGVTPAPGKHVVTRVVIPALRIDLPVVAPPPGFPYCNVAMYYVSPSLGQPGQNKATYLYAHARDGMFGPIYDAATIRHAPKSLVGMIVQVYTADNKLYLYETTKVLLHQLTLDAAFNATSEQLWLQTSEGPRGTPGKTQILAMPLSVSDADPVDAHPTAKPVVCG